jgi:hypothetical protein
VTERHNHGAGQGPVVLDIGDGRGALVLYATGDMEGAEIDISPVGHDAGRSHVAVLARNDRGTVRHAAVYSSLAAGTYRLWRPDGAPTREVEVQDGSVTEVRWEDIASG